MAEIRYPELVAGPYAAGQVVTPADGADLAQLTGLPLATRALAIGVGGTITVDFLHGETAVQLTLPAGIHKLSVTRVRATGTAATNIVALY